MGKTSVVKRADFNGDGIQDRIVQFQECRAPKAGKECYPLQMELGRPDGTWVPVFNLKALLKAKTPEPGRWAMFSPRYYLQRDSFRQIPGKRLENEVALPPKKPEKLSKDQWVRSCQENHRPGSQSLLDCWKKIEGQSLEDLNGGSSDWQEGDENRIFFSYHPDSHSSFQVPIPKDEVLPFKSSFLTPEFLEFQKSNTSTRAEPSPNAWIEGPCLTSRAILQDLESIRANLKFLHLSGSRFWRGPQDMLRGGPPKSLDKDKLKQYRDGIVKLETRARKHLIALKNSSQLPPDVLLGLLDFIQSTLYDRTGRSGVFDGNMMNDAVIALEKQFRNPDILKPLVAYLVEIGEKENFDSGRWPFHIRHLSFALSQLLLNEKKLENLPTYLQLFQLAQRVPELTGPALVAATNWGRPDPLTSEMISRLAQSPKPMLRGMAAFAAPILLQQESIPLVLELTRDQDSKVRTTAYQGLLKVLPGDAHSLDYRDAFRRGLNDPSLKIQLMSAYTLTQAGDQEVVAVLFERMKAYREHSLYEDRWARKTDIGISLDEDIMLAGLKAACAIPGAPCNPEDMLDQIFIDKRRKEYLEKSKMELAMHFPQANDKKDRPITLKSLALLAISKFGGPLQAGDMLEAMLKEETEEVDLMLTAQALVSLYGTAALPELMARLKKPAPDSLFLFTIAVAQKEQDKKLLPELYPMILDSRPQIRQAALWAAQSFDPPAILKALLRDSYDPEPKIRIRVAEALGQYQEEPAVLRLLAMVDDKNQSVQKQAALSLSKFDLPDARRLIEQAIEKKPHLREKINLG